jgi:hypothetical protein
MGIKKLISFDFDDTLVKSPLPNEGKLIWKEKTGEDWPHRGWWSKPESLDMEIFNIPLNKNIYRKYKQAISDPDNYVILATGRIKPLQDEVYTILDHYELEFDEIHLNPGIDTFEFKSNLFAKLINEMEPEEFIMYDDRQEHLIRFVEWAKNMPCKVTLIDAISGEEFKPQNNPLQEHIRRIIREESKTNPLLYEIIDMEFPGFYDISYDWAEYNCGMGVCCDPYAIGFVLPSNDHDDYLFKLVDGDKYDDNGDYPKHLRDELPEPCYEFPDVKDPRFNVIVFYQVFAEQIENFLGSSDEWGLDLLGLINKKFNCDAKRIIFI